MKKSVLLLIAFLSAFWIILKSDASGAGFSQGTDRTGSPISNSYCGDCHSGGTYKPSVEITMLDGTTPITAYNPGKKYTLNVSITASSGTPSGYGYQATVLNAKSNAQAGTLGAAPSGQRVVTLSGRQYAEQSRRSSTNSFQMPWTAPAAGTGDLKVYATGMAVNGDGSTGRDNPVKATLSLQEATATSLPEQQVLQAQLKVYPNPVVDFAQVEIQGQLEKDQLWVQLLDVAGRTLQSKSLQHQGEKTLVELPVKNLPKGHYYVQVTDGYRTKTVGLVK